jgi:ribonuclease HI
MINIFTDGACIQNGKQGAKASFAGWFPEKKELSFSKLLEDEQKTNQRAELKAIYESIKIAKENGYDSIKIYTDSKYTMLCASSFGEKCQKKKWAADIPNVELIKELFTLVKQYSITLLHVSAHTDNQDVHSIGNREADRLATQSIYNLLM